MSPVVQAARRIPGVCIDVVKVVLIPEMAGLRQNDSPLPSPLIAGQPSMPELGVAVRLHSKRKIQ